MKILIYVFYLSVFFPYIKVLDGLDTQPTAFVFSLILVVYFMRRNINKELLYLALISLVILLIFLENINFNALRSLVNYLSLFTIGYAGYYSLKKYPLKSTFLKYIINIWLIVGIIQKFYNKYFGIAFISAIRTTEGRGVTSLAPEPTYYGIICILLMFYVEQIFQNKREKIIYILNLSIQLFFLSKSSMGILYFLILMIVLFLKKINFQKIIAGIVLIVGLLFFFNFQSENRVGQIFQKIKKEGIYNLIKQDASISDRISHVYFPIKGTFNNNFLPNGFSNWREYSTEQINNEKNKGVFWYFQIGDRIMSGFGSMLFETGIIGVFLIWRYLKILSKYYSGLILFYFILFYFSAIPMVLPLNGFLLALCLKNNKQNI